MSDAPANLCHGICLGATASTVVDSTGEILRNELGGHVTASLVAFGAEGRALGEAAVAGLSANAKGTATAVGRLALLPHSSLTEGDGAAMDGRHWQWTAAAADDGSVQMCDVESAGGKTLSSVSLLGALLGKMRATSYVSEGAPLSIALPSIVATDGAEARAVSTLADAAAIGGWKLVAAPTAAEALGVALARKWPFAKADEGTRPRLVLILDMGASSTVVAVIKLTPPLGGEVGTAEASHEVVATGSDPFLGAALFDAKLLDHFAAQIAAKYGEGVSMASRRGLRLSVATERLRKLLSTMKEASATAENLIDGIDVPLTATRDEFNELCSEPLARLRTLLDTTLASVANAMDVGADDTAASAALNAVEMVGGGCRMPCVQQVLSEALAASAAAGEAIAAEKPGAKLDDSSIALGAAIIGRRAIEAAAAAGESAVPPPAGLLAADALQALIEQEQAFAAQDAAAAAKGAVRNELESYVLDSRNLSSRKHGEKVDTAKLNPLLDATEEWIYSDEAEAATVDVLQAKLQEVKEQVAAATSAYAAAVEADKLAEEKALEVAAAAAAAERAANGEDEDHDQRKLKFPDRLRMVQKNKEEGTELFKGAVDVTQFRGACARYNKALGHCAKFVDLSPDQKEEVNALKLSLNLNIAMCWLKITDAENHLDQAIRACDEAISIDGDCVKALFRRATAREQKGQYDDAKADLKKCAELAPDDKAVPKLMTRVEAQIARQKAKEKKMYGKMFG